MLSLRVNIAICHIRALFSILRALHGPYMELYHVTEEKPIRAEMRAYRAIHEPAAMPGTKKSLA